MSMFVGFFNTVNMVLARKDWRLVSPYQNLRRQQDRIVERQAATIYLGGYTSDYWPGNRGFYGEQVLETPLLEALWGRVLSRFAQGSSSRLGFLGTTRDATGSRLGGVTCSLFRTSDKAWIMDVVSNINGDFMLSTYDGTAHFIVFSKTGSPDVIGTTRQTLVGA